MKRKVTIPEHKCVPDKPSCIGSVKTTTGKTHFKCPNCGKKFLIMQNLYKQEKPSDPECLYSHERGYVCSISGLELTSDKGEIRCEHHCYGCKWVGLIFDDVRYDQGFVPGFYVDSTPLKKGSGKQKFHAPPLSYMRDLGCKGLIIDNENDSNKFEDIATFEFNGESHKIIPTENNLYDIGHDKFWLYHKYEPVTIRQKHSDQHYAKDKERTHLCCFVEKQTMKTYIIPQKSEKIYGFQFHRGTLYRYVPSTGLRLADANVFKDNTKFIATNVLDVNRNEVINKDEETWGYLVIDDKIDEFMSLTKRSTRIFSSEDYSGVSEYDQKTLSSIKYKKGERTILEAIEEDKIYQLYLELISLDDFFEVNITEFETVDPKDEQERREQDEDETPWSQDDYDYLNELYTSIKKFIDQYCQGLCGKTEDVLYHLYCDAVDPDNSEFTRWIDNFNGGRENEEYYAYSNYKLIDACKTKHVLKLVHLSSPQNTKAIEELFMIGIQHPSYGNPLKRGKAQEVAFDFINPYNEDSDDGNFSTYENLPQLLKEDEDINEIKLFGPKPIDLWSDKDHKRAANGESIYEIRTSIMGVNAKEDDLITQHCLSWIENKKYIPLPLKNISVSGSRVLPKILKTRYIKRNKDYGSGYFSPAVHVWKGYYIQEEIQLIYARVAENSDCSAIIAALEINEELENRLRHGSITFEEYQEKSIKIVAILHGWYPSITFNNAKLMSILHKVLYYGGYVLCNEPYRKHYKTEVRYPKRIKTFSVIMKVPVTVNKYEELSNIIPQNDLFIQMMSEKNNVYNPIFTYFDRRVPRTNKLLVELGDELITLCRSEYSGTTNTINFALEADKKVTEITSPKLEYRYPQEGKTFGIKETLVHKETLVYKEKDVDLTDIPFLDFTGENDPIQKGRSSPKKSMQKVKEQRTYNRHKFTHEIKHQYSYYDVLTVVPATIADYGKWSQVTFTNMRKGRSDIPYIQMDMYTDKTCFNLWKFFEFHDQVINKKHSPYYRVVKKVPAVIQNYDKWSNIISNFHEELRSRTTMIYIKMDYYTDPSHRNLYGIFS